MKKKLLTKKTLSVFLAVLMLMTSWVFFPGMVTFEASAAATDTTYRVNTDKYGTPYWSPNGNNTRWMLWGESRDASDAHFYMEVPKTIYLDVSETLQSAGYKIAVEWSYGNSTSYRIAIGPAVWGYGYGSAVNNGSQMLTMTNLFDNYDSNVSLHDGAKNEYGVNGYSNANQADLRQDDGYDGNSGVITLKNMGNTNNKYNNIYLIGTPKAAGSGTYSTTEISPDFILTQKWGTSWKRNNDAINMEDYKPGQVSEQHTAADGSKWNEVWWNIEIYDKGALKSAIDNANSVYNANMSYSAYVLDNGLSKMAQLTNEGGAMLSIREQTYQTVKNKTDAINNAAKGLQFQAKNAALISKVADAKALQAKAGYNTLYTQDSRQALQAAIETATNSSLYTNTTVYSIANYTDAGAKAAAEQNTINGLVNSLTTAMNGLVRRYDVGYDNLFSLTDWALNPVKANMSNGTIEIDADQGTIKITHDGSAAGTDNNTSQESTYYRAKVEGNTEYVLTWNTSGSGRGQIHVFYTTGTQWTYAVNPNYSSPAQWFVQNGDLPYSEAMGKHEVTFTTLPEADGLVFRFGTCTAGDNVTFSDIRLVKKSDYDAYANKYGTIREVFSVGDTKGLTYTPVRDGYVFEGWYTADGEKVTDVSAFSASDVVYAHWSQKFTVIFKNWDGTVAGTAEVAPGAAAKAPADPSKAPDADYEYVFAGWDKDFSNVTADLEVTATFNEKEHSNIKYQRITAATCTTPGKITKFCSDCNYAWNNGEAFEDTTGEFVPALGHSFERTNPTWTVVTDKGTEANHTVRCNDCDATTTKNHDFKLDANHPASDATCIKEGETYYKCACLREKTETGSINPDNHVRTELRDAVAAECEKPGYTGDTWCLDCNTKIKTGSATEALEHVYTTYIYNDDAKCGVDGTETATCDLCGIKTDTRDKVGSALEHKYTTYTYNNDAKCEVDGTKTALCDHGCGTKDTITATGTALVHNYTGTVKDNNDGTHSFLCKNGCGKYGGTVNCSSWTPDGNNCKCTVCGYTKTHAWGNWVKNDDNTSDAPGKMTRTCSDCGATDTTNCTYSEAYTPATCETDAYTTYTCTDANCGHGYTVIDLGSKKGHNFNGDYKYDEANDKHQQACANGCGEYGVGAEKDAWADCEWSYANKEAGKHTATCACGNSEVQTCSGGTATCTAQAVCQFCNTAYGEKADHKYDGKEYFDGAVKAKDATCTAQAEYYVYCSVCKDAYTTEETFKYGDLLPHTYTGNTEYLYKATEAECGVNETYYVYCSECKKSSEGTEYADTFAKEGTALIHKFNGTTVCNNDGTHTITCSQTNAAGWTCTATDVFNCADTADILGKVPADCLNAGYTMYQCKLCDYKWDVENSEEPALGHEYTEKIYNNDEYVKDPANCEHGTYYWYGCKWCDANGKDETDTEKYPTLFFVGNDQRKHDFQNKVDDKYLADEATCFAAAKYFTSCKYEDCGKSSEEVYGVGKGTKFSSGTALAHDWTEVEDAKYLATEADCVNDATYYYECSLCKNSSKDYGDGDTWTLEDSKSGHSLTYTEAKAADCYNAGNYEYWYCSTCKKYFKDAQGNEEYLGQSETVIKKREHDLESFSFKAATCEEDGHPAYFDCKYEDCDYTTLPAVLPDGYKAIGHNFTGAWTYDEVHLYHSKFCANGCGKSGMVIDGVQTEYKVELDVIDYVITGGEKCDFTYNAETKDGVHTHANSCVCGNGNTRVYSDEETFVETVAPTCTTKGYDSYACPEEDCDDTWTKNEVAALNHLPADKATSNGDGTHSVYCTREGCGYKISTEKCSGGTATCKDKAVCEKCGDAYGETSDHTFTAEWVYQNDATCGVNGTEKNTCDVCKTEVTREAKDTALEHKVSEYVYELPEGVTIKDFDASALKEPTCKEDGFAVRYCTLGCGYYQTKTVAKDNNAHIWETDENGELVWKDHQGDCATGVTMKNYCTVCGKEQKKTEAGEHKWEIKLFAEPNCVDKGYRVWRCSTCKFTFDEFYGYKGEYLAQIEALGYSNEDLAPLGEEGHSYINTGKNKPATCTEGEKETWQCVHCDEYDYRDIEGAEELGHKLNHYDAQAADCVFEGNVEYYRCTRCDLMFADENATETLTTVTVPTTDHADNDGDGKCDECYRVIYSNEDGEGSCGCICHKENFLMRILYKILNFFWKLFKISKTCECGAAHW